MGIINRAKRILKSHVNAAFEDLGSRSRPLDPLSDEAAMMDDEEWYNAVKARQASEQARKQRSRQQPARPPDEIGRAYANLDCPEGADLKTVREAWRRKMLKYHPDRFPNEPKKRDAATRLTALLNESFQKLEAHLKARGDKG